MVEETFLLNNNIIIIFLRGKSEWRGEREKGKIQFQHVAASLRLRVVWFSPLLVQMEGRDWKLSFDHASRRRQENHFEHSTNFNQDSESFLLYTTFRGDVLQLSEHSVERKVSAVHSNLPRSWATMDAIIMRLFNVNAAKFFLISFESSLIHNKAKSTFIEALMLLPEIISPQPQTINKQKQHFLIPCSFQSCLGRNNEKSCRSLFTRTQSRRGVSRSSRVMCVHVPFPSTSNESAVFGPIVCGNYTHLRSPTFICFKKLMFAKAVLWFLLSKFVAPLTPSSRRQSKTFKVASLLLWRKNRNEWKLLFFLSPQPFFSPPPTAKTFSSSSAASAAAVFHSKGESLFRH